MDTAEVINTFDEIVKFKNPELTRLENQHQHVVFNIDTRLQRIKNIESEIEEAKENLRYHNQELESLEKSLALTERALAKLEFTQGLASTVLNASQLIKTLEKNPNFKNVYYTINEDEFKLYVTFTNIFLKPNAIHDSYISFIEEEIDNCNRFADKLIYETVEDVLREGIKIPDINICISIDTKTRYYVLSCDVNQPQELAVPENPKISTWWPYGYSNNPLPVPHWISSQRPCLGDFGPAINETVNDCDLLSTCTLIHMFLSQADTLDPAGIFWPLWINAQHIEKLTDKNFDAVNSYQLNLNRKMRDANCCPDCGEGVDDCICYCPDTGDLRDQCGCRECDPDAYCTECDYHHDDCSCNEDDEYY